MRRRTDKRPRPEADIRRDLAEQLEAIVRGFEEQLERDVKDEYPQAEQALWVSR